MGEIGQEVIAEHKRRFTRNVSYFEPTFPK